MTNNFQERVFEKLKQTNYAMFDGNIKDASDFIADNLLAVVEYRNVEARAAITAPIEKARDNSEIMAQIKDTKDKAFSNAISSIKRLNTLCKNLGIEEFMPDFDPDDTASVKKAIGKYTTELFDIGINK